MWHELYKVYVSKTNQVYTYSEEASIKKQKC